MSFISPTRPLPIPGTLAAFVLAAIPGFSAAEEWTALLDRDLSRWEVFMGVPHPSVEIPGHPKSTGPKPEDGAWAPHWYDAVWKSSGFGSPPGPAPALEGEAARIEKEALASYERLLSHHV